MRRNLLGSTFKLFVHLFDAILSSMCGVLKSELEFKQGSLKLWCAIDEKHGVGAIVFLGEFVQELLGQDNRSRRKQSEVGEFVGVRVDSGIQPKVLVVESNQSLVDGNVI